MDFSVVFYYIHCLEDRYQSYYKKKSTPDVSKIVLHVNLNLDFPFYQYLETAINPNHLEVLCNKYYKLPDDFVPSDLQNVPDSYTVKDGKKYRLNKNALDAFISMSDAAKDDGISLKIISGYRSFEYQMNLYEKYARINGREMSDRFSARPGHSEHETGLAVDINDDSKAFENTVAYIWLTRNAHLFGFLLRYPKGFEKVTGYMFEPWHYRYLGVALATEITELGLTYDEYFAIYLLK